MNPGQAPRAIVVDASVAVEFLVGNETWVDKWTSWVGSGAILLAPEMFLLEVANALLRSRKLPAADSANRIVRLLDSGIEPSNRSVQAVLEGIHLAEQHRLSAYDAAYLQMALEVEAEIATVDRDLAAAAGREGLAVV